MVMKVVITPASEDGVLAGDFTRTPKGMADEKFSAAATSEETEREFLLQDGDALKIEARSEQHMVYDKAQMTTRAETDEEKEAREAAAEAEAEAVKKAEADAKAKAEEAKAPKAKPAAAKPESSFGEPKPGPSSPTTGAPTGKK